MPPLSPMLLEDGPGGRLCSCILLSASILACACSMLSSRILLLTSTARFFFPCLACAFFLLASFFLLQFAFFFIFFLSSASFSSSFVSSSSFFFLLARFLLLQHAACNLFSNALPLAVGRGRRISSPPESLIMHRPNSTHQGLQPWPARSFVDVLTLCNCFAGWNLSPRCLIKRWVVFGATNKAYLLR